MQVLPQVNTSRVPAPLAHGRKMTLREIISRSRVARNLLTFQTVNGTIYSRPLPTDSYAGDVHMSVEGEGAAYARLTDTFDVVSLNGQPI